MPQITPVDAPHLLELNSPFRQSMLWELQRSYFNDRGAHAWRDEEVPHYITSNPTIARAYAETVFAFYLDRQRLSPAEEPLYICELGAGSGQFGFHFLTQLGALCDRSGKRLDSFRYVLSDFTQSNLDAWRVHPHFQQWFDSGVLDVALFDVGVSDTLALQVTGVTLTASSLQHPLVVIANYLFDGVPQDLFYFRDGEAFECQVSLSSREKPDQLDAAALLHGIRTDYSYVPLTAPPYEEADLAKVFEQYRMELSEAYVLFPSAGIDSLKRLRNLSQRGCLLLSADKGDFLRDAMVMTQPPTLTRHGSFSLNVNFHAMLAWTELSGGQALLPGKAHHSIAVVGLLLVADAGAHSATLDAFQHYITEFGPDDFFSVVSALKRAIQGMSADEILAFLRFTQADAHQLSRVIPRLTKLASIMHAGQLEELKTLLDQCWKTYFPLGEESDLAFHIASLLYEINEFEHALVYYQHSERLYGSDNAVLYNMAACYQQLEQHELACSLLETVLHGMPDNSDARELLEYCSRTLAENDERSHGAEVVQK